MKLYPIQQTQSHAQKQSHLHSRPDFPRCQYSVQYSREKSGRTRKMDQFCAQIPALRVRFKEIFLRFFQMLSFMAQKKTV